MKYSAHFLAMFLGDKTYGVNLKVFKGGIVEMFGCMALNNLVEQITFDYFWMLVGAYKVGA